MTTQEKINSTSGTLCWTCKWAAGKEGKCPWANKFEPVPGWEAKPTKLLIASATQTPNGVPKYTDSFFVKSCPMFEIMTEIKIQQGMNGQTNIRTPQNELMENIERLWLVEHKTPTEIAEELDITLRKFYYHRKKIKEKHDGK